MKCDVTIIGGGMAGLSLACLLGQAGIKVMCLDSAPSNAQRSGDERTTAISYGSQKVLEAIGIWDSLTPHACPIEDIHILDGDDSPLLLQFLSDEVEGKAFGWIIENALIRETLTKRARTLITHKAPAKVRDFEISDDCAVTILDDGTRIESALVIGADGRGSFTRGWMGVDIRTQDYGQRAVVFITEHENPHHNKAVEHFYEQGPFAVLPMVDDVKGRGKVKHRSAVVFTEHGPQSQSMMTLPDSEFAQLLRARFPAFYGAVALRGKRTCYPLSLVHAAEYIGPRMALVADAAHGIHPVAGQGLNLGFRDVKEMADLLISAHETGADLGAPELLQTYQRRRRPDNMAMVAVTDGLVKLFGKKSPPFRLARRLGLRAVAKIPLAKRFFMRQAMADRRLMEK